MSNLFRQFIALTLSLLTLAPLLYRACRRGKFNPLGDLWRGASRPLRVLIFAFVLTAVAYGSDKILGGHIDYGLHAMGDAVASLCADAFTACERLTGYTFSEALTNETHDLTMPESAQLAERIARRGAHNDGFWLFDSFTNRLTRDGHDAIRKETWRARTQSSAVTFQPFNLSTFQPAIAYSYAIAYADTDADTPLLMRGAVAESLDEDGILTVNTYALTNGLLICENRRFNPSTLDLPLTTNHLPLTTNHSTYPYGGDDYVVRTDERGKVTITATDILADCIETTETVLTNDVVVLTAKTRSYFGGGSSTHREWGAATGGPGAVPAALGGPGAVPAALGGPGAVPAALGGPGAVPAAASSWTEERRFTDYDADGRRIEYVVTESSDCGTVTNSVSTYDLIGRLVSSAVPGANGSTITTAYTYNGTTPRLLSSTYTPCGDLIAKSSYTNGTDTIVESYSYDMFGNRTATTDALGNMVFKSYDPFGRVVAEWGATYPVRFTYDTQGRRTSLATTRDGDTWDTTTWAYNPRTSLCLSKTYADGSVVTYTYTPDNLPLRTTYASGRCRDTSYDTNRRLVRHGDTYYTYASDGRLTLISNAEAIVEYAYTFNRFDAGYTLTLTNGTMFSRAVVRDTYRRSLVTAITNSVNGVPVETFAYAYDALGRPVARCRGVGGSPAMTDTFAFNARSEVTSAILHFPFSIRMATTA